MDSLNFDYVIKLFYLIHLFFFKHSNFESRMIKKMKCRIHSSMCVIFEGEPVAHATSLFLFISRFTDETQNANKRYRQKKAEIKYKELLST